MRFSVYATGVIDDYDDEDDVPPAVVIEGSNGELARLEPGEARDLASELERAADLAEEGS